VTLLLTLASSVAVQVLPKGKVLVPGCGRGYAPVAFANAGYSAVGIDLAETANRDAKDYVASLENSSKPETLQVVPPEGKLELRIGNFFEIDEQFDVRCRNGGGLGKTLELSLGPPVVVRTHFSIGSGEMLRLSQGFTAQIPRFCRSPTITRSCVRSSPRLASGGPASMPRLSSLAASS
jgi:SAM-dependent methyltransferase